MKLFIYSFVFSTLLGLQATDFSIKEKHIRPFENDSILILIDQGHKFKLQDKNKEALISYKKAFKLSKEINNSRLILKSGFTLEYFLFNTANNDSAAFKISNYLLTYASHIKDTTGIVESHIRLGNYSKKELDYISALSHYNSAKKISKKAEHRMMIWRTTNRVANLLKDINEWKLAQEEYKKLPSLVPDVNCSYHQVMSYINISSAYKNPDSILHYSMKAIRNCNHKKETKRACYLAYNNIAWAYVLKNNPKKALEVISNNIDIESIQYDSTDSLYNSLMHTLGTIYMNIGDYQNAITYYKKALSYFEKENNISDIIMVKGDLANCYEKSGDLLLSIKAFKEIKYLTLEFDQLKIKKELAKIERKKMLADKEKLISDLESKNQKIGLAMNSSRIFNYFLVLFFIISLSFFLYNEHRNRVRFHQINNELSLNRIKSLRAMMNPHFLFNSFSTLQNYILKKESLKATQYMAELSGLIRNILLSSDSIYISFNKEINLLKSYINIEKERFENTFEVIYSIDDQLIAKNPTIPSMVIQPYIENAIIHGFSNSNKKHLLKLSFKAYATILECKIIDNGIGRDKAEEIKKNSTINSHLSIATRNTHDRLHILSKIINYPTKVIINDLHNSFGEAEGTEVIITLPFKKEIKYNE